MARLEFFIVYLVLVDRDLNGPLENDFRPVLQTMPGHINPMEIYQAVLQ